jgi:hypothetical protein
MAVKDTDVSGVRRVFEKVEPVVVGVTHWLDLPLAAAVYKRRIFWQRRRIILIRAHIGEDQAALLAHRIGQVPHLLWKLAVFWFRRHFQTLASDVKQPAMIRAANPAIFDVAVFQRRSTMRAVQTKQAELAEFVAKQHQLLAKNFYRLGNIVQVLSGPDYEPVFAKPLTRRRPWPNPRDIRYRNFLTLSLSCYFHHSAPLLIHLTLNLEPLNF